MNTTPDTETTTITGPPETVRRALAAALLYTSTETHKPQLARINIASNVIEATDGYHAIRVTGPEIATTAGQIPGGAADRIVTELARIVKETRHTHGRRTVTIQITADTGTVEIVATLDNNNEPTRETTRVTFTAGQWTPTHWPEMNQLFQVTDRDDHTALNPNILATLAKLTTVVAGSKKNADLVPIRFDTIHPRKPALIHVTTTEITATVIAMPMRVD